MDVTKPGELLGEVPHNEQIARKGLAVFQIYPQSRTAECFMRFSKGSPCNDCASDLSCAKLVCVLHLGNALMAPESVVAKGPFLAAITLVLARMSVVKELEAISEMMAFQGFGYTKEDFDRAADNITS